MTIRVSKDVENAINAAVLSGQFASADAMIDQLVREYAHGHPARRGGSGARANLGSIGAMRDSADELDEIVADAYRGRREETWRELDL